MTAARAREIIAAARSRAKFGPWSDQIDAVLIPGERTEVNAVWDTLPGWYHFVGALETIARSDAEPTPQP